MKDFKDYIVEETEIGKLRRVYDSAISWLNQNHSKLGVINTIGEIEGWPEPEPAWCVTVSGGVVKVRDSKLSRSGKVDPHPKGGYMSSSLQGKSWFGLNNDGAWDKIFESIKFSDDGQITDKSCPNRGVKGAIFLLWWFSRKNTVTDVDWEEEGPQADLALSGGKTEPGALPAGNKTAEYYEQIAAAQFSFGNKLANLEQIRGKIGKDTDWPSNHEYWSDQTWNLYNNAGVIDQICQGVVGYLGVSKLKDYTIIHGRISEYYKKLRGVKDKIDNQDVLRYAMPDAKDNTSDLVLFGGDISFGDIFKYRIDPNPTEHGVLTVYDGEDEKGWILQISLKLSFKDAQVGKLKTDFNAAGWTFEENPEMVGDVVVSQGVDFKSSTISNIYQKTLESVNENWIIDRVMSAVKISVKAVKSIMVKIFKKLQALGKTLVSHLDEKTINREADRLARKYIKKFKISEEYNVFAEAKSQGDQVDAIKAFASKSPKNKLSMMTELINGTDGVKVWIEKLKEAIDRVNSQIEDDYKILVNIDEDTNSRNLGDIDVKDIRSLLCNITSFKTLESFYTTLYKSNKNLLGEVVERSISLALNAIMGESRLPVLKLGGISATGGKFWEVLDRNVEKYDLAKMKDAIKNNNFPAGGIQINRSSQSGNKSNKKVGSYSVKIFSLGWMMDNGNPEYLQITLRTSGEDSGFGYFIEANQTVDVTQVRSYCK